jgi:AraC family transcriptional regulator
LVVAWPPRHWRDYALFARFRSPGNGRIEEPPKQINQVIKAIIRAPGEDWTTERLAGLAGISAFHFHRLFRALTGETMFAFLQRRRLLCAIELIGEDRFSLTGIALECGFDSGL